MKIDTNDPTLTAFALGEMDDDEAARIAARLEAPENDAARRVVDEIRRTAEALTTELQAEPIPGLTDQQRARITSPPPAPLNSPAIFTHRLRWATGLAAAACLALAVVLPMLGRRDDATVALDLRESAPAATAPAPSDAPAAIEPGNAVGAFRKNEVQAEEKDESEAMRGRMADADSRQSITGSDVELLSSTAPAPSAESALGERSDEAAPSEPTFASKAVERRARTIGGDAPDSEPGLGQEMSADDSDPTPDGVPSGPDAVHDDAYFGGGKALTTLEDADVGDDAGAGIADRVVGRSRDAMKEDDRLSRGELQDRFREEGGVVLGRGARIVDNDFVRPAEEPQSTFSIDVDTASYANTRRFLHDGRLPDPDAVRIEEFLNAFSYDYAEPAPGDRDPFAVHVEVNQAPWNPAHRLVRIALKGREVDPGMRPATNLVFLVDVSRSMDDRNRLSLVKDSLGLLVDRLATDDRIAIVTYAGNTSIALPSTPVRDREAIASAIERLATGDSTNGAAGIDLAYEQAVDHFIEDGVNRVILCSGGDFNVGVADEGLFGLVDAQRKKDVSLSVFGFGTGNLQDGVMEQLSERGNGAYASIDSLDVARRRFVDDLSGLPVTIAKDVQVHVEFDPGAVGSYRLIGYEDLLTVARDVADDGRDAGEVRAGQAVTVLYEIAPPERALARAGGVAGGEVAMQEAAEPALMQVRLRYKQPDGVASVERLIDVADRVADPEAASADFRFAAAVASFGMVLRDSPHKGDATLESVFELARSAVGESISAGAMVHADKSGVTADHGREAGAAAQGGGLARAGEADLDTAGTVDDAEAAARRAEERAEFLELVERARSMREQP